ncbi:MAG: hypothetical protein MJ176_10265 [Treponema sp.]|nr:hypothetical protein [Treponema sp.]
MYKSIKKVALLIITGFLFFAAPLFAASISDDAKKALKSYAALDELKNRGFKLEMLDNIKNPEDLYNVLLPYMIVDDVPLDNSLSFNGYSFQRHKNIYFTDEYGTIGELLGKGYKPEELFYYPSAGEEKYRVGHYKWEPIKNTSVFYMDTNYYTRPFMSKKIAYFFPGFFTQDYFKPYIKEIKNKEAIVVDCRMGRGWGGQFSRLGEALCSSNYKGKVIVIIDRNTEFNVENDIVYNMRTSYYINGSNKKAAFEWITVGENTKGTNVYANNPKWNYEVGELKFNPLPVEVNKWPTSKEGEGVEPNIWALGDEDINKTIEMLTGETDFANLIKDATVYRNYASLGDKQFWNWPLRLPDSFKKIKSHDEYNASVSKLLAATIEFKTTVGNEEELYYLPWYYEFPKCAEKVKKATEFEEAYIKHMKSYNRFVSYLREHKDQLEQKYWVWWQYPEAIANLSSYTDYANYFSQWLEMRIDWLEFLSDKTTVLENNSVRIWGDALKEEIKEWKDPKNHLEELSAYLKKTGDWIDYIVPEPLVIPKDYGYANLYGKMKRISPKIGKGCSAVPADITSLQKKNPELYVEKMVEYINSVAENDFEKVKLVFDIEQEILTYDHDTYQKDLAVIKEAMKGVGEDYEKYSANWSVQAKQQGLDWPDQDWKAVLEKGICVCAGYSNLMQYFCYKLGIKCTVASTPKEMVFAASGGHAWNIVKINGEHYLLDATWGLDWLFMEPRYSVEKGHFPRNPEEQLLETPMTIEEYKKLVNYKENSN